MSLEAVGSVDSEARMKRLLAGMLKKVPRYRQHTIDDCSAAALQTLLGQHDVHVRRESLEHGIRHHAAPRSMLAICDTAAAHGVSLQAVDCEEFLREAPSQAILHWQRNHFVVAETKSQNGWHIFDPARGSVHIEMHALREVVGPVALIVDLVGLPKSRIPVYSDAARPLTFLLRRVWLLIVSLVGLGVVQAAFAAATPMAIGHMADADVDRIAVARTASLFLTALSVIALLAWLRVRAGTKLAVLTERLLRSSALANALEGSNPTTSGSGIRSSAVISGAIGQYRSFVSALLPTAISDAVWLLGILLLLFQQHFLLSIVVLAANLSVATTLVYIQRQAATTEHSELVSQGTVADVIENARTHQWQFLLNGAGTFLRRRFDRASDALAQQTNGRGRHQATTRTVVSAASWVTPFINVLFVVVFSPTSVSAGAIIAVYGLTLQGLAQVAGFVELRRVWSEFDASADLFDSSMVHERERRNGMKSRQHAVKSFGASRQVCGLRAKSLYFAYGEGKPIIHYCSLDLRPGELVLLQGQSGVGKSTLLHLLSGALAPMSGLVQRLDVEGNELGADHGCLGYVGPTSRLIAGSIRDNISLGRKITRDELELLIEMVGLLPILPGIGGGIEGTVGPGGQGLSSGQTQRVLLARALATPSGLLLLDECFSALDEQSEESILSALRLTGRTILLVSHRSITRQRADRLLALRDGRLYES